MLDRLVLSGAAAVLLISSWTARAADVPVLDWFDDEERPGVQGCESALFSYDPTRRYITDDEQERRSPRAIAIPLPTDPTHQSALELRLIDAIAAAAEWKRNHGKKPSFNVLALSGGGQWGAYGAGFLNGWAAADAKPSAASDSHIRRDDIDLITGISTGAMQLTFAYLGASSDPAVRARAARDLEAEFLDPDIGKLIKKRVVDVILGANSLYSVDGLVKRVRARIGMDLPLYQAMPQRQRLYAGAVNVDDGQFTIADLKFLADSSGAVIPAKTQRSCFASSVLASAAVPLGFPPRYIGGKMYIDGGARFGLFSSIIFNNPRIKEALTKNGLSLAVRVIINGNQSSASYADDGNKPVEDGFLSIAKAAMSNVLDQLYKDSAFRNEQDLSRDYPGSYTSAYTYAPNEDIRNAPFAACEGFKKHAAEDQFDPKFMKCLYEIGRSRWDASDARKIWKEFKDIPVN